MKLDAVRFGAAFGIVYAVVFFLYALAAALFGVGMEMMEMIGKFYVGFGPSFPGAVIGAIWGLIIGFVFFGIGACVYNRLVG